MIERRHAGDALFAVIDQGTSGTRALVVDSRMETLGASTREVASSYPHAGWVEQDAGELAGTAAETLVEAARSAGVDAGRLRAIAVTNQTETIVAWDRESGRPAHPAIGWQCRRAAAIADAVRAQGQEGEVRRRTGLPLGPGFPAAKVRWLLDNVAGVSDLAAKGRLAIGDVASWVVFGLSGGASHVTEPSNASRYQLYNLDDRAWDPFLLDLFRIPAGCLPAVVPSDAIGGRMQGSLLGGEVPLVAALGDQQASLFGHGCRTRGAAKLTLGSGGFVWANAGAERGTPIEGVPESVAWMQGDRVTLGLEGFIPVAGGALAWLRRVGLVADFTEVDDLAGQPAGGVVCVPTLEGRGTPAWDASISGAFLGLTLGSTRADLVGAVLDGVAHQVADALDAVAASLPGGLDRVSVDGGLSQSDWLLQRIADLARVRVGRAPSPDTTALGMAMFVAEASGLEPPPAAEPAEVFTPAVEESARALARDRWRRALEVTGGWR